MGLCLFIKPFRSLKGKLQIKGDFKRHSFASLVRSSFISGASVDRSSLYFLDNEHSPRFTTNTSDPHNTYEDKSKALGTNVRGSVDTFLPELHDEELIEQSDEEQELETLSQKAVDDALWTVAEEYLEDFARSFVAKVVQNTQSEVPKINDIILQRKNLFTLEESCDEKPKTNIRVQHVQGETVPFLDNMPGLEFSPIDYTTLCVPKDYCIFGNNVEQMTKEDRERILSKRGAWPSDEAIDYQFEFVQMMKGIEAENERAEGEIDDNMAILSKLGNCGARSSDESDDDANDDDESLIINFEVGPSEINCHPDPPSHSESNEIVGILQHDMQEEQEKPTISPMSIQQGILQHDMQEEQEKPTISPIPSPRTPPQSIQWDDAPHPPSPPVSSSPPHHQQCPPPPPPYHLIYHNGHPVPLHPMMMGASQEAYQLNNQMMMTMQAAVGAKECEGVIQGQEDTRTGYPHQWQDRRYYQTPAPSQNRVPSYPSKPNFRRGQRFGDSFDGRRHNNHQKRENVTPNQQNREHFTSNHQNREDFSLNHHNREHFSSNNQNRENFSSNHQIRENFSSNHPNRENCTSNHQNRENFTSNQQTRSTNVRHQPRPRPSQVPYNPSRQSPNYDRAPPAQCSQGNRWDAHTRQSHPFRQEWGGSSHHFGSSYHQLHHHQHHVDRNSINRRQR